MPLVALHRAIRCTKGRVTVLARCVTGCAYNMCMLAEGENLKINLLRRADHVCFAPIVLKNSPTKSEAGKLGDVSRTPIPSTPIFLNLSSILEVGTASCGEFDSDCALREMAAASFSTISARSGHSNPSRSRSMPTLNARKFPGHEQS